MLCIFSFPISYVTYCLRKLCWVPLDIMFFFFTITEAFCTIFTKKSLKLLKKNKKSSYENLFKIENHFQNYKFILDFCIKKEQKITFSL